MNSQVNEKCINCKEYYNYKDNLCSNCYMFKSEGKYKITPINVILLKLHNKLIDKSLISFLIRMITAKLDIEYNDLHDIIKENDIYLKYEHAQTIYNLLNSGIRSKNIKLQHILSYKIIDYWNNRLGGASCYYDGTLDKPQTLKDAKLVIVKNNRTFTYFFKIKNEI